MSLKSYTFTTTDGTELWVNRWIPEPECEIKGVIQFHHGLAEHSLRYDRLGSILSENGWVFSAYDMRGHGKTAEMAQAKGTGKFGKLADKNGFCIAIQDLNQMVDELKKEYPDKKTVVIGHSFGSFVTQGFIEAYSTKVDACFLLGTAGPQNLLAGSGKIAASICKLIFGGDSILSFLDNLAFGGYNKRIKSPKTKNDWLTKDELSIDMYMADNWCGFPLTTSFFCDMTGGLLQIHNKKNMKNISVDLPVYMLFGSEDPVGTYGKTIKNLYNIYKANGIKSVTLKEYEGNRHELQNETNKEVFEQDLINFLNSL